MGVLGARGVTAPTLVVGGARDRFYSPRLFTEGAERLPQARLRLYPRKGHAGTIVHRPAIAEIDRFVTTARAGPYARR